MGELKDARVVEHLDVDVFRDVIGHFMTGVTVITAADGGKDYGMSVSAVASVSLDPPMLLACLNERSPTQAAVARSSAFCVNVLAEGQDELARHFARPSSEKFASLDVRRCRTGAPLLADALAWLECRVDHSVRGGTHRVFMARVIHAESREGTPLAYFRGTFGRVEMTADEATFEAIRELVLTRAIRLDEPLIVDPLADRLRTRPGYIQHALARLEVEGLIQRDDGGNFTVTPVDAAISTDTFNARCAIELGVAEATVGRISRSQLNRLRELMLAVNALIADGRFVDVPGYVAANSAFHEYLVSLAGSAALLAAYRRLSITSIMVRLFTHHPAAPAEIADEHRRLVEAYEAGDIAEARTTIRAHTERAKAVNERAIIAGGGRI